MTEHRRKDAEEADAEPKPPSEPPPPPLQAAVVESLAEQLQRERLEIPDSQNPADVVPNRPMIRPPSVGEAITAPEPEAPEGVQPVVTTPSDAAAADNSNPLTRPTNPPPAGQP